MVARYLLASVRIPSSEAARFWSSSWSSLASSMSRHLVTHRRTPNIEGAGRRLMLSRRPVPEAIRRRSPIRGRRTCAIDIPFCSSVPSLIPDGCRGRCGMISTVVPHGRHSEAARSHPARSLLRSATWRCIGSKPVALAVGQVRRWSRALHAFLAQFATRPAPSIAGDCDVSERPTPTESRCDARAHRTKPSTNRGIPEIRIGEGIEAHRRPDRAIQPGMSTSTWARWSMVPAPLRTRFRLISSTPLDADHRTIVRRQSRRPEQRRVPDTWPKRNRPAERVHAFEPAASTAGRG